MKRVVVLCPPLRGWNEKSGLLPPFALEEESAGGAQSQPAAPN